jgi:hypothetical protein
MSEDVIVESTCDVGEVGLKAVDGCPSIPGMDVTVTCNGTYFTVMTHCPKKHYDAACKQLNKDDSSSGLESECSLLNFTTTTVSCSCKLSVGSAYRRRLDGDDDGNGEASGSVDFSTMLTTVLTDFKQTWSSADDLTASSVTKSWDVFLTLSTIGVITVIAVILSVQADYNYNKVAVDCSIKMDKSKTNRRTSGGSFGGWKRAQKSIASDLDAIEESLPVAFHSKPFSERFILENKKFHKWMGVVFYYSPHFPRVLRVISLATSVIVMLFIQAVTYSIAEPDDGTCEAFVDKTSCLSEPSTLAQGENKCLWDDSTSTCSFNEPANDLMRVVFVAVLSAMWSAPIALFVDWLIMKVLAAKVVKTRPKSVQSSNQKLQDILPSNEVILKRMQTRSYKRYEEEVEKLNNEIREYRLRLSGDELKEFDGKQFAYTLISLLYFCNVLLFL